MKIVFQTRAGSHAIDAEPGENVLFAGLRGGLALPYECATGTCGTCRCRVMEGPVELRWPEAPGLVYVKPQKNETLMCQAAADGDCVVRVPGDVGRGQSAPAAYAGQIGEVQRLTHDVAGFSVVLDRPMSYRAGQFVVVECDDVEGGRGYSMTNHARSVNTLDFVVKRMPGGGFSEWLFGGGPDGRSLRIFGPLGKAAFDPEEKKNILCIAGGSGIAGMMAILEHGENSGYFQDYRADVFFGVRTGADVFFADALNAAVETVPENVSVTVALSDAAPDGGLAARYPALRFRQGFVHDVAGAAMKDRYDNVCAYVAGPPPMVDAAIRVLIMEGKLAGPDIRYDKFS